MLIQNTSTFSLDELEQNDLSYTGEVLVECVGRSLEGKLKEKSRTKAKSGSQKV
jgi:hypothetical protein